MVELLTDPADLLSAAEAPDMERNGRSLLESVPDVPDHELLRCIGRGGGGTVWLARTVLGGYRAVKVVTRTRFESDLSYEREFEALRCFEPICRRHPEFLQVFHVGRSDRARFFYYSMELADSMSSSAPLSPNHYCPRTLSSLIKLGALPPAECLSHFVVLTNLLALLHAQDLIHRDLKPSNILFVGGHLKLADVGLVTPIHESQPVPGTPGYAPKEGAGSIASDLYSLGRVMYELLTGYSCSRFPELPVECICQRNSGLYAGLNDVVIKACHPVPTSRYRSAVEMHKDLFRLSSPPRRWWSLFRTVEAEQITVP